MQLVPVAHARRNTKPAAVGEGRRLAAAATAGAGHWRRAAALAHTAGRRRREPWEPEGWPQLALAAAVRALLRFGRFAGAAAFGARTGDLAIHAADAPRGRFLQGERDGVIDRNILRIGRGRRRRLRYGAVRLLARAADCLHRAI